MTAEQRRERLTGILKSAEGPLAASALAAELSVSRQIIVGDVALLRAAGLPVIATPRGYVMNSAPLENTYTIACKHSKMQLLKELYLIADCGCSVLDVTVEHPVYGQISGALHISSRYDADLFMRRLTESDALPLSALTGEVHLHTVSCPTRHHYDVMLEKLEKEGFLAK